MKFQINLFRKVEFLWKKGLKCARRHELRYRSVLILVTWLSLITLLRQTLIVKEVGPSYPHWTTFVHDTTINVSRKIDLNVIQTPFK